MTEFRIKKRIILGYLFILIVFGSNCQANDDFRSKLRLKFKSCFWGMACAESVFNNNAFANKKNVGNSFIEKELLKFSTSIIKEGGFAPDVCLPTEINLRFNSGQKILDAYKDLLVRQSKIGGRSKKLLFIIPLAMAYIRIPEDAYSAAEFIAYSDEPNNKNLLGSARAFVSLFHSVIRENYATREDAINRAIKDCGIDEVRLELKRIISDQPLDAISVNPAEVMAVVFRAWYDSSSYSGALMKLGKDSTFVERSLLGALAGATYGIKEIQHKYWPPIFVCQRLERTCNQIGSLAADGILLPVKNYKECQTANAEQNIDTNNKVPVESREKLLMAPPEIPSIPEIPDVPNVLEMTKAPNYKVTDVNKVKINQGSVKYQHSQKVITAADVPLVKQRASSRGGAKLKLYWLNQ